MRGYLKNQKWIYTYSYAPNSIWEEWRTASPPAQWIIEESKAVASRVNQHRFKVALLADSHYTINDTWEDTAASLKRIHELVKLDGIVHLGDLTDGMLPREKTQEFENNIKKDLFSIGVPAFFCSWQSRL